MKNFFLLLTYAFVFLLWVCGAAIAHTESITVLDVYQREVSVPFKSDRFIAIGPGALRLYTYIGEPDRIVGIETFEKNKNTAGRPYAQLYEESFDRLPDVGPGGPQASFDAEGVLNANPDVIIVSDHYERRAIERLQANTGIPVVTITRDTAQGSVFNEKMYASLRIIGAVTGNEARAEAVITYIEHTKADLIERTASIKNPKAVYLGCLPRSGVQGIRSTSGHYDLLDYINAENVVSLAGINEYVFINKEQLLMWDPEIIVIDANGYELLMRDIQAMPEYYDSLQAFNRGDVFMQMPYNYYSTNIEIALANAYYLGTKLYPEAFADIKPAEKTNEISRFFLNLDVYEALAEAYYGGYQSLQLDF